VSSGLKKKLWFWVIINRGLYRLGGFLELTGIVVLGAPSMGSGRAREHAGGSGVNIKGGYAVLL